MLGRLALCVAAFSLIPQPVLSQATPSIATLPAGLPLRVTLDHLYSMRTGTEVQGHLASAVYLIDHVVLPVDTPVYGVVSGHHPVPRRERVNALLDGDFTPLVQPEIRFESLRLPDGSQLEFSAPASVRNTATVRMGTSAAHNSPMDRVKTEIAIRRQEAIAGIASPGRSERLRQMIYGMIPYHPQNLWTGEQFDAELSDSLTVPQPLGAPAPLPVAQFATGIPTGTIEARLTQDLTSAKCPVGMTVEAVLSKPLFDQTREHLLLPEGTRLSGSIVESQPADIFGRNGRLRFTFRKIELAQTTTAVHGIMTATEGAQGDHLTIDSEGGARANSPNRALGTLTLAVLATAAHDEDSSKPLNSTVVSNGFGLMARLFSIASANRNVASGFAYYALAKNVYRRWIARGKDVTFPKNTRIQIELAAR